MDRKAFCPLWCRRESGDQKIGIRSEDEQVSLVHWTREK